MTQTPNPLELAFIRHAPPGTNRALIKRVVRAIRRHANAKEPIRDLNQLRSLLDALWWTDRDGLTRLPIISLGPKSVQLIQNVLSAADPIAHSGCETCLRIAEIEKQISALREEAMSLANHSQIKEDQ